MHIQSILAVTDRSEQGNRTVQRAAMLAVHHGALLKIICAAKDFRPAVQRDTRAVLTALASDITTRYGILVKQVATAPGSLPDVVEEARWVDLVVVGEHLERSAATFFRGQPVEEMMRHVACPVLVVRRAVQSGYRRVLVSVDFSVASKKLVKFAWDLDRDAEIELFHALTPMHAGRLRYADVTEHAIKSYQHECVRDARERMFWLTDSSAARRNRVFSAIGRGDSARQAVVQQQHSKADLLAVGKRSSSALSDFCFGSVAERVLRWSSCDVLLVPHDLRIAPRPVTVGVAEGGAS